MNLMSIVVMVFGIIEVSIQKPDRLVLRNFRHDEGRPKNRETEGRRTREFNFPIISDNESQHRRYVSENTGFTFKPLNENDTISKDFIATMDKMVNSSKSGDQDATASSNSPKKVQNQKHCNGGARSPHKTTTNKPTDLPRSFKSDFKAPKAVNYTKDFPPVKNQGSCQSCWAFAAVSLLEYRKFKAGENVSYSEQNLVDCSSLNYGCGGGWPTFALIYIRDYGISDGRKYLYKNAKQDCQRNATQYPPVMNVTDVCEVIVNGKEDLMVKLIAQYGPVSGALMTTDKFTQYKSGVFFDVRCSNHTVDHAITIVGYGSDKSGGDYWIIRNSWGPSWGINGYALIARNKNNHCGIALYAMFPCDDPKALNVGDAKVNNG